MRTKQKKNTPISSNGAEQPASAYSNLESSSTSRSKYDLSQIVTPKVTGNTELDTQIANQQFHDKLRKKQTNPEWYDSFDNPKHNDIAKNIQSEINNNVLQYQKVNDAINNNYELGNKIYSEAQNPNLTPEQHNAYKEQLDNLNRQQIYNDATAKTLKAKNLQLQRDKSNLIQAKQDTESVAYNNEYHPLDSGYNFLANAWNSFLPNAIAGVGDLVQTTGDIINPNAKTLIAQKIKKEASGEEVPNEKERMLSIAHNFEQQSYGVTDILGKALNNVGKSLEASTEGNHPEKHQIAGMLGGLVGNVAQIALGTKEFGLAEKGAKVLTAASFGLSAANTSYDEATNAGLSGTDRDNFVLANTAVNAALVALPASRMIDGAFKNTMIKDIVAESLDKIKEKGITGDAIFDEVKNTFKEKSAIMAQHVATNALKSTAEGAAFGAATGAAEYGIKKAANKALGKDTFEANPNDIWESTKMMALGGGLMGTVLGGNGLKGIDKSFYDKVVSLKDNPHDLKEFNELLDAKIKSEEITPQEAQNITQNIQSIQEADSRIPKTITDTDKRIEAINLISQKSDLKKQNEQLNSEISKSEPAFTEQLKKNVLDNQKKIDNINSDLELIAKGTERTPLFGRKFRQKDIQNEITKENIDFSKAKATFEIGGETITIPIPKEVVEGAKEFDDVARAKAEQTLRQQAHDEYNKQISESDDKESQQREIPSEKQIGQELVEEKPIEETSGEKTSPSGILQEQEVKQPTGKDGILSSFASYEGDIPYKLIEDKVKSESDNLRGNPQDIAKVLEDNGIKVTDKPEVKVEEHTPTEEEINHAYEQRAHELDELRKSQPKSFKEQFIHDNIGRVRRSDIEHYNDVNNLAPKGEQSGENITFFKNDAVPLDTQAQQLSEMAGMEITPQDIADYIIDRKNNPEKYHKQEVKKYKQAEQVPIDVAEVIAKYSDEHDMTNPDVVESLRHFPLSDEEVNAIKDYIENGTKETTDTKSSKGTKRNNETKGRSVKVEEGKGTKESRKVNRETPSVSDNRVETPLSEKEKETAKSFERLDEIAKEFEKGEVTKELRDERKLIFADEKVKKVNDNFSKITEQLVERGDLKKSKGCP